MLVISYALIIFYIIFIKRRQKLTWLISFIILSFLSITSSFYADLDNYIPLFNFYNSKSFIEIFETINFAWALMCKIFGSMGLNYRGMVICLLLLNCFLLHRVAKNMDCNENLFFGLFLIFPAVIQMVQIKFFTGSTVVLFAYSVLIKKKKFSIPFFLIGIFLASIIHSSCMIFIFLLLVLKEKIDKRIVIITSIFMAILFRVNINWIVSISSKFLSSNMIERYLTNSVTPSTVYWIIKIFFSWVACYILSYYISIQRLYKNKDGNELLSDRMILNKNYMVISLLVVTLPLLFLDRNFHRFLEFGYMLLYVMLDKIINIRYFTHKKFALLCIIIILLLIEVYIYIPFETVLNPIFSFDGFVSIVR